MNKITSEPTRIFLYLLLAAALLGFSLLWLAQAQAATLPTETCTYDSGTNTRTCELWATTGTLSLPGTSVSFWGYAATDPALGGVAELPGPAIIANQGETVQVTLHNLLGEATGLRFQGQAIIPDMAGVLAFDGITVQSKTYTFVASQPGTFLYEAALLPNAQHQTAMGMYGALIVRPTGAPGQAYADGATAFDDEALVVLSEVDPALNNNATPADFDMRYYSPKYWLINGKAYPDTDDIASTAGNQVLLRYINAGLQPHTMNLLGLDQALLGVDGSALPYSRRVVVNTVAPGQTMDALVSMPASAPAGGGNYALYDGSLLLHNNAAAGFGGMLAFITLGDGTPPSTGPRTTSVALSPDSTTSPTPVSLSATIPGAVSAEYFIDTQGTSGTGTAMSDAGSDVWIETLDTTGLSTGAHTIYVHGTDGTTWGAFNFAVLHLDNDGPMTKALVLSPNPSNGSVPVNLTATGDDTMTGGSDVIAAEYFVDAAGSDGAGTVMDLNQTAPIVSLSTSTNPIPAGLAAGTHTIYVHSQDAFGHWGDFATIDLVVSQSGPTTSNVTVAPNPNNGSMPINPSQLSVRVDATINAVAGTVKAAEGFINTVGTNGTGFPLTPKDGLYNSPVEGAYAFIPLTTISALSEGTHPIWVHGKDSSGNWGDPVAADLVIDKTPPTVSDVAAAPNPTNDTTGNNTSFALTATAADNLTNITAAEWYEGTDPGAGNGNQFTFTPATSVSLSASIDFVALGWTSGDHTVYVRAKDSVGYWTTASVVVSVVLPNDLFADGFESGDFSAWSATGGTVSNISVTSGAAQAGTYKMQAQVAQNSSGYVQDNRPFNETGYHARFYFNPNNVNVNQTARTIFVGLNAAGQTAFELQVRRSNGNYQVRAVVSRTGGTTNTNWYNIANNAFTAIEIDWASAASASFRLYTGGTLRQTLTNLNTGGFTLDTVRLGPQGTLNGLNGTTWYFDSFASTRRTVIGP